MLLLSFSLVYSQTSSLKLPTSNNSSNFSVLNSSNSNLFTVLGDSTVGINQASPNATVEIGGLNGLLVTGTYNSGTALSLGAGTRMHWYPKKAAFRVGQIGGTQWDDANIGAYSFAAGANATASGNYSIALGSGPIASGINSFAIGYLTTASGDYSFANGYGSTASGAISFATGDITTASGIHSFANGFHATASGNVSFASGYYVSTNSNAGAFILGDNSTTTTTNNTATNQMMMRFAGGYILYTNLGISTGVQLSAGGSSWSTISDSTKKEKYKKADGEYFLKSISKLKLGSWNYKVQDPKKFRHYGPMAQEIYHYFGNDGIGAIGVDTLLASADMDGIEMIAIQSLVKRTKELKIAQLELKNKTDEIEKLKLTLNELKNSFSQLKKELAVFITNSTANDKHQLTMHK